MMPLIREFLSTEERLRDDITSVTEDTSNASEDCGLVSAIVPAIGCSRFITLRTH